MPPRSHSIIPFVFVFLATVPVGCSFVAQNNENEKLVLYSLSEDAGRSSPDDLTPEEMNQFRAVPDSIPNYGFSSSTYWLRFEVSPGEDGERLLEIAYPPLDEVVLFEPLPAGGFRARATGDRVRFDRREIPHRNFVFRVRSSERPYYLRIKSESALLLPVRLFSRESFIEKNRVEQWLLGTFYGALFIMVLYNSFLLLMLRDASYLFYVLNTTAAWFYFLVWNGLAFEFVWPDSPAWNNQANPFFQGLATVFLFLFFRAFLKGVLPKPLDRFFLFLVFPSIGVVLLALADLYGPAIQLGTVVNLAGLLVGIPAGLYLLGRGYRPVRFLMLAWSFLLAAFLLNMLRAFQIVPATFFTQMYAIQIGSGLELALLSLALADRFRRLEREREEARQSSAAKSAFLANMSHEIRTPLHAILGMTELLEEEKPSERGRNYLSVLRNAGENLLHIVNDVLDISKIEAGKLTLETAPFRPEQILDEAVDLILPEARAKGLEVGLFYDPRLPAVVRGDPGRLRQVLLNLLSNAVKFTDQGEIYLEALRDSQDEKSFRFLVRDTGIGIKQDKREEIFEAFTQADDSTTRRFGGTGLGLTICRRLVDLMGGRLRVDSTPGRGSRFYFSIPLPPADKRGGGPEIPDLKNDRALLIVNPGTPRLILQKYLQAAGIKIEEMTTADLRDGAGGSGAGGRTERTRYVFVSEQPRDGQLEEILALLDRDDPNARIIILSGASDFSESDEPARLPVPIKRSALFRLLATPRFEPASEPAETTATSAGGPLRILLAEDNEDNRLLFLAYLKRTPHRIEVVEEGRSALERFKAEAFDLVFVDIQMPVMDGLTATGRMRAFENAELRAGRRDRRVPIYALTANVLQNEIKKCLEVGCDGHIGKPVSKAHLLETIARHSKV